jgi:hypothetical protein
MDFETAKILGHRRNLERYHRLLGTTLTALERQYILSRITEETAELERLELRAHQSTHGEPDQIILAPKPDTKSESFGPCPRHRLQRSGRVTLRHGLPPPKVMG